MGKAIEYVVAVLFFVGVIWFLAYVTYMKIHKMRRKENKQDEVDREIKW